MPDRPPVNTPGFSMFTGMGSVLVRSPVTVMTLLPPRYTPFSIAWAPERLKVPLSTYTPQLPLPPVSLPPDMVKLPVTDTALPSPPQETVPPPA